jgi:cystathionine beta-lyase
MEPGSIEGRIRSRRKYSVKWTEHPKEILPAWIADMDFGIPPLVKEGLTEAIELSEIGYAPHKLTLDYLEAFSNWQFEQHQVSMSSSNMIALTDVIQGFYLAIDTLCAKDAGVLFLTPSYPPFFSSVNATKRKLVTSELVLHDRRYQIDFDDFADKAKEAGSGGAILLCNPQNPTGRVFDREEISLIAQIALSNNLWIISDEIHADLRYEGSIHTPIMAIAPEVAERCVTLSSASKSFNLAGLHTAVLHAGSPEILTRLNSIPAGLRGSPGSLGLLAGKIAFGTGAAWLKETLIKLDSNRKSLFALFEPYRNQFRSEIPEATYLAWLDFSQSQLKPTAQQYLLEKGRVALNPGEAFIEGGTDFARLNFATEAELIPEMFKRITSCLPI